MQGAIITSSGDGPLAVEGPTLGVVVVVVLCCGAVVYAVPVLSVC